MTTITDILLDIVAAGGSIVTKEEEARRLEICRACPKVGKVDFFGKALEGCTLCGCPLATLTKAKRNMMKGLGLVQVRCSDKGKEKW